MPGDAVNDDDGEASNGAVHELHEQLVAPEDEVDCPHEILEAVPAHRPHRMRNHKCLAGPAEGEEVATIVVGAGVAPEGIGEDGIPGVSVEEYGARVTKPKGPGVHLREELPLGAGNGPADPRRDPEVPHDRQNRGHEAVDQTGHGTALRRIWATRGACTFAEKRVSTVARADRPTRRIG